MDTSDSTGRVNGKQLLYDIDDLNHLFRDSPNIETLLNRAVETVADRTQSAVCSIYLYNPAERELTLRATRGLHPESVGKVRLKLGEGLTGLALQEMHPICERDASRHPNYKYFPGILEERYDAFLAVPISRGLSRMGVLVVQRGTGESFSESDITTLETVASQLANIIENAQFVLGMHEAHPEAHRTVPTDLKFIRGKVASEGYAYAPARVSDKQRSLTLLAYQDFGRTFTLDDFHRAVADTAEQLEELQESVEHKLSDAASLIFAAHLMILKDRRFLDQVAGQIAAGVNAPVAVVEIAREYMKAFLASDSPYMREKINDIEDLAIRLVSNIVNRSDEVNLNRDHAVITRELFPSDLLRLSSEQARAIVLVGGGVTSHISILARSLEMPMVIVDTFELLDVPDGTPLLVDAQAGNVLIDPDDEVLKRFTAQQRVRLTLGEQKRLMQPATQTADGIRVMLMANINLLSDAKPAAELGCDGIGLYRTEFPFIVRTTFPTEAEQYVIYRKLADAMPGKPVTFRTLDAGGDKILSYYHDIREQNPAMGMRSIRFSLRNKAVFSEQIRAILRAGAKANLRIMFPMISSVDEFLEARQVVRESLDLLARQGVGHHENPKVGMMVELPSVADLIEDFAREADFLSVGTNDLTQFMLGVDRTNEAVADLYLPHHPAVLRTLNRIAQGAVQNHCDLSVCGDMAHQPEYIPFLLGIGVKSLSVDPIYLLRTQQTVAAVSLREARTLAREMLSLSRVSEITALLQSRTTAATEPPSS